MLALTPSPVDVAPQVAAILEACRALGATISASQGSSCYIGRCAYGTPSYRSYYDAEAKGWRSTGPEMDVTIYRAEWPLEPIPGRDPWCLRTTGPNMFAIAAAAGVPVPAHTLATVASWPAGSGVRAVLIYSRAATLATNGDGRGVVLATGRGRSEVADEDERGVHHLATNAAGALELGMFAT